MIATCIKGWDCSKLLGFSGNIRQELGLLRAILCLSWELVELQLCTADRFALHSVSFGSTNNSSAYLDFEPFCKKIKDDRASCKKLTNRRFHRNPFLRIGDIYRGQLSISMTLSKPGRKGWVNIDWSNRSLAVTGCAGAGGASGAGVINWLGRRKSGLGWAGEGGNCISWWIGVQGKMSVSWF